MVHPIKLGKNERMSYSKIDEVLEMPNLIEVQKNSYQWFIEKGLKEVLEDVSPIQYVMQSAPSSLQTELQLLPLQKYSHCRHR